MQTLACASTHGSHPPSLLLLAPLEPHSYLDEGQVQESEPTGQNARAPQVMAQVRSGSALTRTLFERAYAHKKACLLRGDPIGGRWGVFYDALVFSKIRAKLGGEVKFMTSGGLLSCWAAAVLLCLCGAPLRARRASQWV